MSTPILYEQNTAVFNNNGFGALSEALSCYVTERTSGFYELEMDYPTNGRHYAMLESGRIILAKANDRSERWQPFEIYNIMTSHRGSAQIYAQHVKYGLKGIPVGPIKAANASAAAAQITEKAYQLPPFTIETDVDKTAEFETKIPRNAADLLWSDDNSFLSIYGGEPEFDQYTVKMLTRRGSDNGITIRAGKNLSELEYDRNFEDAFTSVYPFWYDSQTDQLIELPEKIRSSPVDFGFFRTKMLDLSGDFNDPPTQEQLQQAADRALSSINIGLPKISMEVKYAGVGPVGLYDHVTVQYPQIGVNQKSVVSGLRYNVLLDRPESVDIGAAQATLSDLIPRR